MKRPALLCSSSYHLESIDYSWVFVVETNIPAEYGFRTPCSNKPASINRNDSLQYKNCAQLPVFEDDYLHPRLSQNGRIYDHLNMPGKQYVFIFLLAIFNETML